MATLIPSIGTSAFDSTGERRLAERLERDAQLVQPDGARAGKLVFPWSYGVVFPFITRKQFEAAELSNAIEPHRVICQDEMQEMEVGGDSGFGARLGT